MIIFTFSEISTMGLKDITNFIAALFSEAINNRGVNEFSYLRRHLLKPPPSNSKDNPDPFLHGFEIFFYDAGHRLQLGVSVRSTTFNNFDKSFKWFNFTVFRSKTSENRLSFICMIKF